MSGSNDELLKKARDMDPNVEFETDQERKGAKDTGNNEVIDPAGLSGADTQGG
ncbi:hypothetical protein JOC77_000809 [Peribacillus deserti]|uniref:Uncharacterized protein n=1 Tax=Peribacillus deserti TaxID=673318 RepID=A0ABS2QE39_9BACI|nr:hypothetical protein [Peribacillus deserti]MBM7691404.1 hypothetical protein [Peribacillus deserti]